MFDGRDVCLCSLFVVVVRCRLLFDVCCSLFRVVVFGASCCLLLLVYSSLSMGVCRLLFIDPCLLLFLRCFLCVVVCSLDVVCCWLFCC